MATPTIAMIPSGYKANKVYSVLPTNGDADLTFARTSTRTRVNSDGLVEDLLTGVPALDYTDGECPVLSLEQQSTNLYLNSDTLVTQDVTTSATSYTVSFYGTGTITFTGTYSGSLVGTGANDRVSLTFTATAGTLTSTISGTVEKGQIEALGYATSYIPTSGATATRVAETLTKTGLSSYINSVEGTLYVNLKPKITGTIQLYSATNNRIWLEFNESNTRAYINNGGGTVNLNVNSESVDFNTFRKVALTYEANNFKLYVNGVGITISPVQGTFVANSLTDIRFNFGSHFYGDVKDVRLFNTVLTNAELTTLTTL